MKIDSKTLAAWRAFCSAHKLENSIILFETSDEEIKALCNGIGSAGMPAWARQFLDALHPSMRIPAASHDLEYSLLEDRSAEAFHGSNARFGRNCAAVVRILYRWYDPRRYAALYKARQFAGLLDIGGKSAWRKARKAYLKSASGGLAG